MQDHDKIDYSIEIATQISCDGYKIQGPIKVTNASATDLLIFDEPGTLGINIGWRLMSGGTTLAEGRLNPNGAIAPGASRDFDLSGELPYAFVGRRLLVVDLVIDTVAWLGTDHPDRMAQVFLDVPPTEMFDPLWYRETYDLPDDMSDNDAKAHYKKYGQRFGNAPNPYLSPALLQRQAEHLGLPRDLLPEDLFAAHGTLIEPHPLLRRTASTYGTVTPPGDIAEGEFGNFSWFILRHLDAPGVRVSPFLDPGFVQTEDGGTPTKPINYALSHLYYTDAQLSSLFDPEFYLATNPDVRALINEKRRFRSALQHFLEVGMRENRAPIPDFDVDYYRHHNSDVHAIEQQGGPSLTEHFFYWGIAEGRNPNAYFDTGYYLAAQPDVPQACKRLGLAGPFEHFLKIGYTAGYKASRPLLSRDVPDEMGKALYEKRCHVATTTLLRDGGTIAFAHCAVNEHYRFALGARSMRYPFRSVLRHQEHLGLCKRCRGRPALHALRTGEPAGWARVRLSRAVGQPHPLLLRLARSLRGRKQTNPNTSWSFEEVDLIRRISVRLKADHQLKAPQIQPIYARHFDSLRNLCPDHATRLWPTQRQHNKIARQYWQTNHHAARLAGLDPAATQCLTFKTHTERVLKDPPHLATEAQVDEGVKLALNIRGR